MLDAEWIVNARCRSLDRELFFDKYEEDPVLAKTVDDICLTCPAIADCFTHGTTNGEWGVWGGVYLIDGEVNNTKNAHKSRDKWLEILEAING